MSVRLVQVLKLARLFTSTPNSQQWRDIAPPGQKACELHGMVLVQEEDIRYQGDQRYRLTHPDRPNRGFKSPETVQIND